MLRMKKAMSIILIGIMLSNSACFKINDGVDEERLLTDEMKSQNPYELNDKIYFISDSAQEYQLTVRSRENEFHEFQNGNYATNYLIELEKTYLRSIDTAQLFNISLEMSSFYYYFTIRFLPPTKPGMSAQFDLPLNENSPKYMDSAYINNKWYYDVFLEEVEQKENAAYRLYYSVEFGVIKVEFSDNSYWVLEKLK